MKLNVRLGSPVTSASVARAQGASSRVSGPEANLIAMAVRKRWTQIAFWLFVVAPTLSASIFYGAVAVPRYASEARFIVRSVSSPQTTGIDMLFRTFGIAKTADDAYLIQKYLQSRDALRDLIAAGVDVKAMFSRKEVDRLSRYPRIWREDSNESLFDFFVDHVAVTEDVVKGIIQLRVVAFKQDDALAINKTLLRLAEQLVNNMNERAQDDALKSSTAEVKTAEDTVMAAQTNITQFRNKEILIDPSKSGLSLIETVGDLTTDLARTQAQLTETLSSAPRSPSIPSLRQRVSALQARIEIERGKMAGNDTSLSVKISNYEQLALRRDIADKELFAALNSLEVARQEARRQHIYVEELVQPNLPDESTEPERIRGILTIFVIGFALFSVIWIVAVGAGEHSQ